MIFVCTYNVVSYYIRMVVWCGLMLIIVVHLCSVPAHDIIESPFWELCCSGFDEVLHPRWRRRFRSWDRHVHDINSSMPPRLVMVSTKNITLSTNDWFMPGAVRTYTPLLYYVIKWWARSAGEGLSFLHRELLSPLVLQPSIYIYIHTTRVCFFKLIVAWRATYQLL